MEEKNLSKAKNNEETFVGVLHPPSLISLQSSVIKFVLSFLFLHDKGFKNSFLPGGGVNIVASFLHMHLAGITLLYDISRNKQRPQ